MFDELIKRLREESDCPDNYPEDSALMREAADAIEQLTADLERSKEWETFWEKEANEALKKFQTTVASIPRWIPVTERLPEDDTICILTNGVSDAIGYRGKVFGWHLIWTDYLEESDVTHWMPLPEPPKEE